MTKLPILSPGKVAKALQQAGFERVRQRGSHFFFKHPDGRATVIPMHRGEDIGRGLLRKILRDIEMTPKDFLKLL